MGVTPEINVYNDGKESGASKAHTRDTHLSIEEFPPTLEEEFRFRPSIRDEDIEDRFEDEDSEARHRRRLAKRQKAGWRPGVREWLVIICVSIVVMMDAFDATVVIPLVPVGNYAFLVCDPLNCFIHQLKKLNAIVPISRLCETTREHLMAARRLPSRQRRRTDNFRHAL